MVFIRTKGERILNTLNVLCLVFLFFNSACAEAFYYYCWNEKGDRGKSFSHNSEYIRVDRMHLYFKPEHLTEFSYTDGTYGERVYQAPLTKNSTDAAYYNIKKTDSQFIIRTIVHLAADRKVKLPSGEIVNGTQEVWNKFYSGQYSQIIILHAIFPVIEQIIFDRFKESITVQYIYKFPPYNVKKILWKLNTDREPYSQELGLLNTEDRERLFQDKIGVKSSIRLYPRCEKESFITSQIRYLIDVLRFLW